MTELIGTYHEIAQDDAWFSSSCHVTISDSSVNWNGCKLHKDATFIKPRIHRSTLHYESESHGYRTNIEIFIKNGTIHLKEIMEENQSIILKKKK